MAPDVAYFDTNVYQRLADSGGEDGHEGRWIRLAIDYGMLRVYISSANLIEMAGRFGKDRDAATRTFSVAKRFAMRRGIYEWEELIRREVRRLRDPSVDLRLDDPKNGGSMLEAWDNYAAGDPKQLAALDRAHQERFKALFMRDQGPVLDELSAIPTKRRHRDVRMCASALWELPKGPEVARLSLSEWIRRWKFDITLDELWQRLGECRGLDAIFRYQLQHLFNSAHDGRHLRESDAYDHAHVVYASYTHALVTDDANLRRGVESADSENLVAMSFEDLVRACRAFLRRLVSPKRRRDG